MIWFTSDLHFTHRNIIRSVGRPFSSVEANGLAPVSLPEILGFFGLEEQNGQQP